MNPAAVGVPQDDYEGDDRWMSMHQHYLIEAKEKEPDVLFIGASIVQQLAQTPIWKKMFEPLHSLNFGIAGDQTQHVLWRLENGELDSLTPKVVVLNVGSNNRDHNAEQVAEGVLKIVDVITSKIPSTQVIVLGLTPRGHKPNPLREKHVEINAILAKKLKDRQNAMIITPDFDQFVDKEGLISPRDLYDFLHFTNEGYQKLCEPVLEEIQNLLKTFVKCESIDVEDS